MLFDHCQRAFPERPAERHRGIRRIKHSPDREQPGHKGILRRHADHSHRHSGQRHHPPSPVFPGGSRHQRHHAQRQPGAARISQQHAQNRHAQQPKQRQPRPTFAHIENPAGRQSHDHDQKRCQHIRIAERRKYPCFQARKLLAVDPALRRHINAGLVLPQSPQADHRRRNEQCRDETNRILAGMHRLRHQKIGQQVQSHQTAVIVPARRRMGRLRHRNRRQRRKGHNPQIQRRPAQADFPGPNQPAQPQPPCRHQAKNRRRQKQRQKKDPGQQAEHARVLIPQKTKQRRHRRIGLFFFQGSLSSSCKKSNH